MLADFRTQFPAHNSNATPKQAAIATTIPTGTGNPPQSNVLLDPLPGTSEVTAPFEPSPTSVVGGSVVVVGSSTVVVGDLDVSITSGVISTVDPNTKLVVTTEGVCDNDRPVALKVEMLRKEVVLLVEVEVQPLGHNGEDAPGPV